MRALVTGAAGFIGAHVVRQLLAGGHEVLALLRPGTATGRLSDVAARVVLVPCDLSDTEELARALDVLAPQAIIHAAWYARPADYLESPENLASLDATSSLVRLARAAGCPRFVGVGTCLEYADLPRPRREDDPCDPASLYALSKLAAFHLGRALTRRTGTTFAWARVFHPYGPGEDSARVLPSVAAALRSGTAIELSSCLQQRDPVRVEDVASALVLLASSSAEGPFNVCGGPGIPLRELLEELGRRLGRPELLLFGHRPDRAGEPSCLVGDPGRLRSLGWQPAFPSVAEGLAYLC